MGDWDAVIDVSNVCWSPVLPPLGWRRPVWDRLALVADAWRRLHGSEAHLYLVADESLARALDDPSDLRQRVANRDVLTAPVADAIILRLARERGLHVITRDHYVDHRGRHPWIEQFPDRFHGWDTVEDEVQITPLGITARSAQEVSMARELKDLKRTRLDPKNPEHRRILHTRWKCGNTSCSQGSLWQGQLLVWPMISGTGQAVCPSCDQPLEDLGPRAHLYEVVVAERASQAEIMRFPLEADIPVIVGRGSIKGIDLSGAVPSGVMRRHSAAPQGIPLQAGPHPDSAPSVPPLAAEAILAPDGRYPLPNREVIQRVSRLHLLMRIEEVSPVNWRLAVIDLESTNGTEVERWAGAGFRPSRPVLTDRETFLSARDRLVLGGAVQLRLSGKRYVMRPSGPGPVVASEAPGDDGVADGGDEGSEPVTARGEATIVHPVMLPDQ